MAVDAVSQENAPVALRERRTRIEKPTDQPGPSKPRTRASFGKGDSLVALDVNAASSKPVASRPVASRRGTAAEPSRAIAGAKRRNQQREDDLDADDDLAAPIDEDAARVKRMRTSEPDFDGAPLPDDDEALQADDDADVLPLVPYQPAKDEGWEDLDAGDEDDPLMVSEYVNEVYDYLLQLEVRSSLDHR